jgi:hypothetical protein
MASCYPTYTEGALSLTSALFEWPRKGGAFLVQ